MMLKIIKKKTVCALKRHEMFSKRKCDDRRYMVQNVQYVYVQTKIIYDDYWMINGYDVR